ncbi:NAD(P)/FAD-dependent oxidoreductase [Natranaerobius thermophilus]|uniref:FAD-dependent pyridine nucleotide-disulphide oxidoreductase n=1 Tax=Natranaerobius thermophilus (strain ATCC BAA-1301 / DSM 18059 / JW/NM-WN-LF) TaxID=457570 RepID=B2A8D1_NATTJ|nr:FAD-dependent oxidoreductase [Natranaerobius thermophilus]ACB84497.1 FAD-dependent pyridine nucleotide-disulphide oxidoreductase [Natranaerobius thermophilus JW/NM-WN-LF]
MNPEEQQKFRVIIVGSGVAARSAIQSLNLYKNLDITVIRRDDHQIVPCAIPYTFKRLQPSDIIGDDKNWDTLDARIINDEVVNIDRENKMLRLKSGSSYSYDRLILATGANPIKPPIKGMNKENVFFVEKNARQISELQEKAASSGRVVIIGGGFIGVEIADELSGSGKDIHLIETEHRLLPKAFDSKISDRVEKILGEQGVTVHTNKFVTEIKSNKIVMSGQDKSGEYELATDMVICAIGVTPNSELAEASGIAVNSADKGIIVDDYYYSSDPNILACGDCISKRDFNSGGESGVRLASTAASEGKVAGFNIFNRRFPNNKGVINLFNTKIGDTSFAAAGITEFEAKKKGCPVVSIDGNFPDRHPTKFSDVTTNYVKLIFNSFNGKLLGGQVQGSKSIGEFINTVGLAIQHELTAYDLASVQYATHPLLTTGPSGYPLLKLSIEAIRNLTGNEN